MKTGQSRGSFVPYRIITTDCEMTSCLLTASVVGPTVRQYGQCLVVLWWCSKMWLQHIAAHETTRAHFIVCPPPIKNRHCHLQKHFTNRVSSGEIAFETYANRPRGSQSPEWLISPPLSLPSPSRAVFSVLVYQSLFWNERTECLGDLEWSVLSTGRLAAVVDRPHWRRTEVDPNISPRRPLRHILSYRY